MRLPPRSLLCLLGALAIGSLGAVDRPASEAFQHPFAPDSPWNTRIPGNAAYAAVPGSATLGGSIYYGGAWTTGIYLATSADRQAHLYIHDATLWQQLSSGEVRNAGNSQAIDDALRVASSDAMPFAANPYSTVVRSPPGTRTWPSGIRGIQSGWRNGIVVPIGAAPSPDSDGHLAIMQPDGLMLECYCAVVCGNGDVVCVMAGFSDPAADGTGRQNGRTASMIPNYAGHIRRGEITAGLIPHAMSCSVPPTVLAPAVTGPAAAFDMNDGYSGTLPMGTLLAIPAGVDPPGLSAKGLIVAAAARTYGVYIVDRGGAGGISIKSALDADDANYPESTSDATIIVRSLRAVSAVPAIVVQPAGRTIPAGASATFTVQASGIPAPTCQWQRNGVPIAGATGTSYATPAVTTADHGTVFRCVLTNAAGSAISDGAVLDVSSTPRPVESQADGGGGGGCGGGALSVILLGLAPLLARRH